MGHISNDKDEVYRALAERLNKNPIGTPVNEALMKLLHRLYTETEASLGSKLPLVPMTLNQIAAISGTNPAELKAILECMADKGLVVDIPRKDSVYYTLAPMVVGFFEYTFMRVRDNVNMKELAELFDRYFRSDASFAREFAGYETKDMRTLVYESLIPLAVESETLNYERASDIIRQSGGGAISHCACRHKSLHLGKPCGAPLEVCTSFGSAAEWIVRRGNGKAATVSEMLRVLDQTENLGLVHILDNVFSEPAYLCHCCGCCCGVLNGIKKLGVYATHPSNFVPVSDSETCTGCGICAEGCHIGAITLLDDGRGSQVPSLKEEKCLGCGVCASVCPNGSLTMSRRAVLHTPPENTDEKNIRIATEKGRTWPAQANKL